MPTRALKKKSVVTDPVEPAVTPPPKSPETTFLTKPKLSPKSRKRDMPEGLWTRCPQCEELIYDKELDDNLKVCPKCGHHFSIWASISSNEQVSTREWMRSREPMGKWWPHLGQTLRLSSSSLS